MMNANDEAQLNDLLDGRLGATEARALEARLEAEPDLRAAWDDLGRIRSLLREPDPLRAPPDFLDGVQDRVAAARLATLEEQAAWTLPSADRRDRGRMRLLAVPLAAAAVLMIGLVVADRLGGAPKEHPWGPTVETASQLSSERDHKSPEAAKVAFGLAGGAGGGGGAPAAVANRDFEATEEAEDDAETQPVARGAAKDASRRRGSAGRASPPPAAAPVAPGQPRFRPGDAVPSGLRAPSDEVRPDPGMPLVAYALATESPRQGKASLATLFDGRLVARPDGAWHLLPPPPNAPMAASSPDTLPVLARVPTQASEPVRGKVDGRSILGSMLLVLSPDEALRLEDAVRLEPNEASPPAPASPSPPAADKTPSKREDAARKKVRVRVYFVR